MLMALGAHRVTGVPVQATCLAAFVIKSQELAEIGLMPVGAPADLFALLWGIFQSRGSTTVSFHEGKGHQALLL